MEIRPFVGAEASDDEVRQRYELYVGNIGQTFPGFPPQPFDAFAESQRSGSYGGVGRRRAWGAWDGDRLLGFGSVIYPDHHMLDWAMPVAVVDESHQRRGIANALLREIVADARAEGRTMFGSEQVRLGTAGEQWVRAVGFENTLVNCWQMLHVADVDPVLWDVAVPAGFRLERWVDATPESIVAAFAAARNAIVDRPTGDSSFLDSEWTVERVREAEANLREAGDESRFVVAVHEESGAVAALTGMILRPPRVDLCWQRDTAVVRQFRGLGLGRVVKAAMMRWLLADFPDLGMVATNNAADNVHMIRVNEQIGYSHYADIGIFEAPVEQVGAALGMQGTNSIPGPRRQSDQSLEGA